MAYYSSEGCGYPNNSFHHDGCINNYEDSDIKYVVDSWINDKVSTKDIINARLITSEEIENNIGYQEYEYRPCQVCDVEISKIIALTWIYSGDYDYWTMNNYGDINIITVEHDGKVKNENSFLKDYVVRPVVELYKNDGIKRKTTNE